MRVARTRSRGCVWLVGAQVRSIPPFSRLAYFRDIEVSLRGTGGLNLLSITSRGHRSELLAVGKTPMYGVEIMGLIQICKLRLSVKLYDVPTVNSGKG